jgi:hypothetical protein
LHSPSAHTFALTHNTAQGDNNEHTSKSHSTTAKLPKIKTPYAKNVVNLYKVWKTRVRVFPCSPDGIESFLMVVLLKGKMMTFRVYKQSAEC